MQLLSKTHKIFYGDSLKNFINDKRNIHSIRNRYDSLIKTRKDRTAINN